MSGIAFFNEQNGPKGYIKFFQSETGVIVIFNIYNLKPNKLYGCHIHEYGDISSGCKSLGSHWNPKNQHHGYICLSISKYIQPKSCSLQSHAGDLLNNIKADKNGKFRYSYLDTRLNMIGDVSNSIIGRSVVIHKGVDDLGLGDDDESLKTGNAGTRLACAIIGQSNSIV